MYSIFHSTYLIYIYYISIYTFDIKNLFYVKLKKASSQKFDKGNFSKYEKAQHTQTA